MNDLDEIKQEEKQTPDKEPETKEEGGQGKSDKQLSKSTLLQVIDNEISRDDSQEPIKEAPETHYEPKLVTLSQEKRSPGPEFKTQPIDDLESDKLTSLLNTLQKYSAEYYQKGLLDGFKIPRAIKNFKANSELLSSMMESDSVHFTKTIQSLASISQGSNTDIQQAGNEIIEKNLETIGKRLDSNISPEEVNSILQLVNTYTNQGSEEQKTSGIDFLLQHFEGVLASSSTEAKTDGASDEIFTMGPDRENYDTYRKVFSTILNKGSDSQKEQGITILKNIAKGTDVVAQKEIVLNFLGVPTENPEAPALRKDLVNVFFEKWGLDYDKVIHSWDLDRPVYFQKEHGDHGKINFPQHASQNLERMIGLESLKPNILHTLNSEFNIDNFGRYPMSVLLDQFDNRDRTDLPYSTFLFAKYDWDGVLEMQASELRDVFEKIKDKHAIRIVEADGDLSAVHVINKLRHKYGQELDTFVMAHGSQNSMTLGDPKGGDKDNVSVEDLNEKGAHALQLALEPGSNVYLISCEVGGQFVKKLASVLREDNTVSGSIQPIAGADITPYFEDTPDGKRLRFHVKYRSIYLHDAEAPTIIARGGESDSSKAA